MTLAFQLNVVGQIFAAELVLPVVSFFIVLSKGFCGFDRRCKLIVLIGLAYFMSQVISDVWNETSFDQYSRGWARIALFIINLVSIYILVDNKRLRLILFCVGFSLGRIFIVLSGLADEGLPWKIGFAKPTALLLIILLFLLPIRVNAKAYVCAAFLVILGVFDILMDFRSHGFILISVAAILFASTFFRKSLVGNARMAVRPILGLGMIMGIAGLAAFEFYAFAAQSGWLSERAISKFETQVETADAPLIVAGRSEVLIYFDAILDSFLIGHGSWPENSLYADRLAEKRFDHGLSEKQVRPTDQSIPIHSHIFGSWVEAGILGAFFWINVIHLVVQSLIKSTMGRSKMRPLYLYGAILLVWDILFSPFSGFRRLETALLIVVVLRSLRQRQPSRLQSRKRGRRGVGRRRFRNRRHGHERQPRFEPGQALS
jgi:hypothetical protein